MAKTEKNLRGILQVLPELRGGDCAAELSEMVRDMAKVVKETQLAGKVTLTLTFKPAPGASNALVILDDMKATKPKKKVGNTLMFSDEDGSVTRNNPDQMEMQGLTVVRHGPGTKVVDGQVVKAS